MINQSQQQNNQSQEKPFREYTDVSYIAPKAESVRWAFDYDITMLQLRAKLMGGWLSNDAQKGYFIEVPADSKGFLNEYGIEQTMAIVNGFIDGRIQGLTVFSEERILQITKDLHHRLTEFYFVKMELFGLTPETAKVVMSLVLNLFESNIRKSLNGQTLKLLGESERIITRKDDTKRKILPF